MVTIIHQLALGENKQKHNRSSAPINSSFPKSGWCLEMWRQHRQPTYCHKLFYSDFRENKNTKTKSNEYECGAFTTTLLYFPFYICPKVAFTLWKSKWHRLHSAQSMSMLQLKKSFSIRIKNAFSTK